MPKAAMSGARHVVVVGAGAAGYFGAIACAEADPAASVTLYEATAHPLAKVRVSGGGRCNVTHACFDPREMSRSYPRGGRELIGPLTRFGPADTVAWFRARGVELKTEADGRMFPTSDDSASIVACLQRAAEQAGVRLVTGCPVRSVERAPGGGFTVGLGSGASVPADRLLLASGGTKSGGGPPLAAALGHTLMPPVPSLFTFHVEDPRIRGLEGLCVQHALAVVKGSRLRQAGPVLVTHWGLSGPCILRLSAWGARELGAAGYRFVLQVNWAEPRSAEQVRAALEAERAAHPRRQVANSGVLGVPARLWERLVSAAGLAPGATWAGVSNDALRALAAQATGSELAVTGKSMNKEEFVTCGGVRLDEVDMATMESRLCPGLHFAGEVLDIDGVTGGFNFQAAWTTGWQAGRAMARP